jgi:hypothetical protein
LWAVSVAADDDRVTKKIGSLSDFSAKLNTLEYAVDSIAFAGALALLARHNPEWEFSGASGFGSVSTGVSSDLGAVAAAHEYGMGKIRGAIFRNEFVSDEQREQTLQILDQVKALILVGYELNGLIDEGDMAKAGEFYRERVLNQSDKLNNDIDQLTVEIEQAIKFSAL